MRLLIVSLALASTMACGDDGPTPLAPSPRQAPLSPPQPPASATFRATGTVVEIEGGPVADAVVRAVGCSDNSEFGQTLTDVSGRFTLDVQSVGSALPPRAEGRVRGWRVRLQRAG